MKTSRRQFLKGLSLGLGSVGMFGLGKKEAEAAFAKKREEVKNLPALEIARDESYWFHAQQAFDIDRSIINLNNGGVHPAPRIVIDAVKRYMDWSNGAPVLNSWRYMRPRKELIRKKIADMFGCSPEEIALVRNVTEALQIALVEINRLGVSTHHVARDKDVHHVFGGHGAGDSHRGGKRGVRGRSRCFPGATGDRESLDALR